MGDTAQHMQLVRDFSAVAKERQKAQTFVSNTVWECSHGHRCEHGVYVWYGAVCFQVDLVGSQPCLCVWGCVIES